MTTLEFLAAGCALGAVALGWNETMRGREAAHAAARDVCRREGLQLLDDTVTLARLRPARDEHGRLVLERIYAFEFSDTGDNRRAGSLRMSGRRVVQVEMEPWRDHFR